MKKHKFLHKNDEEIKRYLIQHNLHAHKSDTGLYYCISKQGQGRLPTKNSYISIGYIGYLINGSTFDKSEKLEINMEEVIAGWTEGLQYFKEGGEGILFIPAHLAYGDTDYGNIPGGSILIFDIQLYEVL